MKEIERQAFSDIVGLQGSQCRVPNFLPPENVSIRNASFLEWYESQDSFQKLCHSAMDDPGRSSNLDEVKKSLAGGLFQDIASIYIIANQAKSNPERTAVLGDDLLPFFIRLYPNARVIHDRLTGDSLVGVSVPDGLIADESKIVSVCEFTLMENKSYFKNKYLGLRTKKRNFPELFAKSNLLFVVPKTLDRVMQEIKAAIDGNNAVKFIELPFSRYDFRMFIEEVCRTYGIGENALMTEDFGMIGEKEAV